ncbi:MAG: RND transporter [Spirochaetia bacterium]|nr:RND transporter [Spirochaetia bacterium]
MKILKWIDTIPMGTLLIGAVLLALAPFNPPHLYEKFNMLLAGELQKPIDIFDLFMHGTPLVLVMIKLIRKINKSED